ncbi:Lytic polysaccharide monooxygenase [Mycena sanguinolenta]|uniref:Lytic polysaccharide monooxygenase n=1 Tax=Mycena sanguinolenta TaxID=230812 RepID=A0A8H6XJL0_9AGAR|nr:Lytic polysaccharide monooxygenase [Mycena sanguinolenta]
MINIFALASLVLATLHMGVAPASAHGYVSQPPSRQAFCRNDRISGCGDVQWEPQSVEAPKGSFKCNGDGPRFPQLNDNDLWADYYTIVPAADTLLSFTWTLTAAHRTTTWEYFVQTDDNKMIASFDDGGAMPPTTVVHHVDLSGYTGRQTILARWNIADTINAFYACVDLDISADNIATVDADAAAPQIPLARPELK